MNLAQRQPRISSEAALLGGVPLMVVGLPCSAGDRQMVRLGLVGLSERGTVLSRGSLTWLVRLLGILDVLYDNPTKARV